MYDVSSAALFLSVPTVRCAPERELCLCSSHLLVLKTEKRKVATLDIGLFYAHETILYCKSCGREFTSDDLKTIVPDHCNFGYDVIVYIGKKLFLECINESTIQNDLKEKNIDISLREINNLGRKFVIYLALVHKQKRKEMKIFMKNNGGYILHLDATCEGDSPHIMTALDEVTNIVMNTIKVTSEKAKTIIPFLNKLKSDYGRPIAIVSDMGKGIMNAVNTVFPKVPYFICHFHFLRDIGKDLLEPDYTELRKLLRKYNIRVKLREGVKKIKQSDKEDATSCDVSILWLKQMQTHKLLDPLTLHYLLFFWILNYKSELRGLGFPFDLSYLVFFKRLKQAYIPLSKLRNKYDFKKSHKNIINTIAAILEDPDIQLVTDRIIEKEKIFNKLRECMQIALPESKEGLNDTGTTQNILSIKQKVSSFRNSKKLNNLAKYNGSYQKMISQIDKYWNYLFTDPIVVSSNSGDITIQPQRTNNILEQFFRDLKRRYRKKSGTSNLSKSLKAMLAETPLIKNLENQEYMKLITGDQKSLEELFSDIDENDVRDLLSCENEYQMSKQMKEIARTVNFPLQIAKYIKRTEKGKSNGILRS